MLEICAAWCQENELETTVKIEVHKSLEPHIDVNAFTDILIPDNKLMTVEWSENLWRMHKTRLRVCLKKKIL